MASTNHLVAIMPLATTAAKFHQQQQNGKQTSIKHHRTLTDTTNTNMASAICRNNQSVKHSLTASKPQQIQQRQYQNTHQDAQSETINKNQDGKRTLIKNQLNLIEQLQLENANLRNERDQLQLENEELKFQLQMISSSHILNQPGGAFTAANVNDNRTIMTDLAHHSTTTCSIPRDLSGLITTSNNEQQQQQNTVTSTSGLAQMTATPLRQRSQMNGLIANDINEPLVTKSFGRTIGNSCRRTISNSEIVVASQHQQQSTISGKQSTGLSSQISKQLPAPSVLALNTNSKFFGSKSSSLASFNVDCQQGAKPVPSSLLLGSTCSLSSSVNTVIDRTKSATAAEACCNGGSDANQDNDCEEQTRTIRSVCQRLNINDSERLVAAVVIIQRAFRKYQICKRFRMITEQLRHTCQSRTSQVLFTCSDGLSGNQSSTTTPADGVNDVTFAHGTTRAAAWESLSYAASRLAAAAAKQTTTNQELAVDSTSNSSVTKSISSQQVNSLINQDSGRVQSQSPTARSTSATPSLAVSANQELSRQQLSSTHTNSITKNYAPNGTGTVQMKSSDPSVVAAALNFQQLESLRKRQYRVGLNIFNKSPEKGISFLIAHSFIDCSPPSMKTSTSYYLANQLHFIDKQNLAQQQAIQASCQQQQIRSQPTNRQMIKCQLCYEEENLKRNVAHFLLHRRGLAREKIGQYLGNLQSQFNQDVLKYYLMELDFSGLQIDSALRKFSSTLRMPGEAQKIERFVDYFAQRYLQCQLQQQKLTNADLSPSRTSTSETSKDKQQQDVTQKNNLTLMSKDEIFILTFAIIMLNTDLHSPSLKSQSRMSGQQFINNLRGVFKSQSISESDLMEIYERVKSQQITTAPDHVTHVMKVQQGLIINFNFQKKESIIPNLCVPHRRLVCFCRLFEVCDINKKERAGQHQREIFLFNDMILVTKLARRAKMNTSQQYTYRQSIPLNGLSVQLFQSQHYNFGIRFCRRTNNETLIMFNARNELDQSRFVDDLSESIAEMEEMETIRIHNVIDIIHSKHKERLKRHTGLHEIQSAVINSDNQKLIAIEANGDKLTRDLSANLDLRTRRVASCANNKSIIPEDNGEDISEDPTDDRIQRSGMSSSIDKPAKTLLKQPRRLQSKFSSMSNLSSVSEGRDDDDENNRKEQSKSTVPKTSSTATGSSGTGLRWNRSFILPFRRQANNGNQSARQRHGHTQQPDRLNVNQRCCSSSSVHSLDSGLFLSRDVSPNQSG